jgi:O-antigen/teichoic acid export membrane protein
MALVSLPMCFGLVSVASPLMSLWLGNGYQEASLCLMVLAFMIPLKCIGDIICYQVMMCAGKEFYLMIAYTITMAINFGNNMILIPRYGALGASVASLLSEIIVFVLVYVQARKYQAYEINRRNIVVTLISTIAMTTFVAAIQMLVDDDKIKLFGGALAGVIVFFLLSILLKNTFMTDELLSTVLKKRRQG